jgi:hypothetical protein
VRYGWWLTDTSYTSRILVEAWIATHERPTPPHALCPLSVVAERALGGSPPDPPPQQKGASSIGTLLFNTLLFCLSPALATISASAHPMPGPMGCAH